MLSRLGPLADEPEVPGLGFALAADLVDALFGLIKVRHVPIVRL